MCNSCGCSHGELRIEGEVSDKTLFGVAGESARNHTHDHHEHHNHDHHHDHVHHEEEHQLHFGKGPAHAHAPGMTQARMVQIEEDILSKNNSYAAQNRGYFALKNILALNLVSSPGSGKTTLLTETLRQLPAHVSCAVIEGDQETMNDAERIRETGVQAIQINTGKGCHLDAHMVGHALEKLKFEEQGLLFIENVGNLVCPASFDLGEAHKVAILSVTEGEDKPIKYPDMFYAADVLLLNKVDLLPHLQFDVDKCIEYARQVNPTIDIILCSATSGEGMAEWLQWLETKRCQMIDSVMKPLQERIAMLDKVQGQSLLKG